MRVVRLRPSVADARGVGSNADGAVANRSRALKAPAKPATNVLSDVAPVVDQAPVRPPLPGRRRTSEAVAVCVGDSRTLRGGKPGRDQPAGVTTGKSGGDVLAGVRQATALETTRRTNTYVAGPRGATDPGSTATACTDPAAAPVATSRRATTRSCSTGDRAATGIRTGTSGTGTRRIIRQRKQGQRPCKQPNRKRTAKRKSFHEKSPELIRAASVRQMPASGGRGLRLPHFEARQEVDAPQSTSGHAALQRQAKIW